MYNITLYFQIQNNVAYNITTSHPRQNEHIFGIITLLGGRFYEN
nr:MAG TPA: hypothetical protein [Caudoviricetes sp.]